MNLFTCFYIFRKISVLRFYIIYNNEEARATKIRYDLRFTTAVLKMAIRSKTTIETDEKTLDERSRIRREETVA